MNQHLQLIQSVECVIERFQKQPIWLAYSGGVDSQVLLHVLATLKQTHFPDLDLTICHIHHGLSQHADDWQQFAKQQALQFKLPFVTQNVSINKQNRQSLEALAREHRYQALESLAPDNAVILTAHHQNDQLETFLLALKRGSGLRGLSAMNKVASFGQQQQLLVRPLLNTTRADIEHFAKEKALTWEEDESNQDTVFDRNFFRQQIIPLLTERWPSFSETASRSATHCRESQEILDEIAQLDLTQCQISATQLSLAPLLSLSEARFNQVIRLLLKSHQALMPSQVQLEQLYQQLQSTDATPQVKLGDMWLRKYQQSLYLTSTLVDVSDWQVSLEVESLVGDEQLIVLPDNLGIVKITLDQTASTINDDKSESQFFYLPCEVQQLTIGFQCKQKKCLPDYRHHSRELKKIWQEQGVPPWQRKRIPLLLIDDELTVALGQFICQPFNKACSDRKIKVSWLANS